jgi:hypothetical protein
MTINAANNRNNNELTVKANLITRENELFAAERLLSNQQNALNLKTRKAA